MLRITLAMHFHLNLTIQLVRRCYFRVSDFIYSYCLSKFDSLADKLSRCRVAILFEILKVSHAARFEKHSLTIEGVTESSFIEAANWVSIYLREPRGSAANFLLRNRLFVRQLENRRNTLMNCRKISRYCKNFKMGQRQEYLALLSTDQRSRILVSYHFGEYVYGMNYLACLEKPSS